MKIDFFLVFVTVTITSMYALSTIDYWLHLESPNIKLSQRTNKWRRLALMSLVPTAILPGSKIVSADRYRGRQPATSA